jgi:hypothetical protein
LQAGEAGPGGEAVYGRAMAVSPEKQLASFLAKFSPAIALDAKAAIGKLDKLMSNATRLVYDNYNALVIAFAAGPKMTDVICSIALYPQWVTLFFMRGATLPDPKRLLEGDGKHIRSIRLVDGAAMLDRPAVRDLLREAIVRVDWPRGAKPTLEIRAVVAKQRPRRPARR